MENKVYKGIIGAVIGDVVGSAFEFGKLAPEGFKLFRSNSSFTDDTVLTMAVAEWMLGNRNESVGGLLIRWGREYPHAGYGRSFRGLLRSGVLTGGRGCHNGSAMRVSPVGFMAKSLDEALALAKEQAAPTHNSVDGIRGAQAIAAAIYMAKNGCSKEKMREYLETEFGYDFSVRCDYSGVDEERMLNAYLTAGDALWAFFAAGSYEETIRLAVGFGGDTDSLAAMAGGVASAFWGVPESIVSQALVYLPSDILAVINAVDGTSFVCPRITPPKTSRWKKTDYLVCGSNVEETDGESGFSGTIGGRFNRNPNKGWYIHTIGTSLETIRAEVNALLEYAAAHPENRFLVKEMGVKKAGFSESDIAPLFRRALSMENVWLPAKYRCSIKL